MSENHNHTVKPDRLSATLALDESVGRVCLVSPIRAKALAGLGIKTVRDLVTHFPRRYVDLSVKETVAAASIGSSCTIEGVVHEVKLKRPKPRLPLVEIALIDKTGLLIVTCFRQPWLADQLKPGMRIAVAGKLEFNYGFKRMTNPYLEILDKDMESEGMVIPVHPACEKISPAWMRRLISNALDMCVGIYDPLPLDLRTKYRLMSRQSALCAIHFPHSMSEVAEARRRLAYEELLFLQLALMQDAKGRGQTKEAVAHRIDGKFVCALEAALPFALTDEQIQARQDILTGLSKPHAMNHMLLGDVGTGKTVVAAFAIAAAADSKGQALLMAPTEVLAHQHGESIGSLLDVVGVSWAVLTGSTSQAEREAILASVSSGSLDVLIGTHALLESDVVPKNMTLAVIDEQQRFGVDQRAALLGKGGAPDALYLTATPIPRTLALALFGNLTLSYLTKRPRAALRKTFVHRKADRWRAYDAASEALSRGEQVYVVCPLVGQHSQERNEKAAAAGGRVRALDEEAYEYAAVSIEDFSDFEGENTAAAIKEASFLQSNVFAKWNVSVLHGRMPAAEKQDIMKKFSAGDIQVLVATTVIEVGVDVPNATVMIVEDADRFGLSQLHQLRGRVGRGDKPAQVHLISASKTDAALSRLAAMERIDDGFELASYDLSLRREGDILGNRQHGASSLKLVNVIRDGKIVEAAHADAAALLREDPYLENPLHRALSREVKMMLQDDCSVYGG